MTGYSESHPHTQSCCRLALIETGISVSSLRFALALWHDTSRQRHQHPVASQSRPDWKLVNKLSKSETVYTCLLVFLKGVIRTFDFDKSAVIVLGIPYKKIRYTASPMAIIFTYHFTYYGKCITIETLSSIRMITLKSKWRFTFTISKRSVASKSQSTPMQTVRVGLSLAMTCSRIVGAFPIRSSCNRFSINSFLAK